MEFRSPLTDIQNGQVPLPRRKMEKRTYGKRGFTAASRVAPFVDENEMIESLAAMQLSPPPTHIAQTNRSSQETKDERKVRSKQTFLHKVSNSHQIRGKTSEYVRDLMSESLNYSGLLRFPKLIDRFSSKFSIVKLAEGSFGECYKLKERPQSSTSTSSDGYILKVVPINPEADPSSKKHSSVAELVREVKIHRLLDSMEGFTRFREVYVVQGKYPLPLLEAFRDFKAAGIGAYNNDPEQEYNDKQLFSIFDLGDAGKDLESLRKPSAFQIFDIFWSTAIQLANAEESIQFEHRDLHVGNVCIKPWENSSDGSIMDIDPTINSTMTDPPPVKLGLANVRTTIIDYTLSRATDAATDTVAFNTMQTFSGFTSPGNGPEEKCQFATYRRMRECVLLASSSPTSAPSADENLCDWSLFVPRTNVVWLTYLLQVLLNRAGRDRVLPDSSDVSKELQREMLAQLKEVKSVLKSSKVAELPGSAAELVEGAVREGWLGEGDVRALRAKLAGDGEKE